MGEDDEEQPETFEVGGAEYEVLSGAAVSRIERRNLIARRIANAMAVLGYGATRKDIAAMAGVTVATLRRYMGPSRQAPDPGDTATAVIVRKAVRAAERDRRERQGWHPDQQRLRLRQPRRVGCESGDLTAEWDQYQRLAAKAARYDGGSFPRSIGEPKQVKCGSCRSRGPEE